MNKARGFSLVELVTVVVLLAILALVALPRVLDLGDEGFKAAMGAVVTQFQSAINLSNQMCILQRWASKDNLPGFGSGDVDFNANCLPSDTSGSNVLGANAARCMRIFQGVLSTSYTVNTTTTTDPDFLAGINGINCRFTFRRDSVTRRFDYGQSTGLVLNVVNP